MKEFFAAVAVYAMLFLAIVFFTVCGWIGVEVGE